MKELKILVSLAAIALVCALAPIAAQQQQQQQQPPPPQPPVRTPDVPWVPSQDPVVAGMLKLANVTKDDVVYDLGCGDGKIVIAAAKLYGARGVGVDIDPQRIKEANENAERAGVADKVKFIVGDIFDPSIKISDATVVALYLLPRLNIQLRPRLWNELKPGTRIVSNSFGMGDDWPAEKTQTIGNYTIYFWTIKSREVRLEKD